jgi:hypothetical protein
MKITKGDKSVTIPGLLVVLGLLVLDNVAGNICRTIISTKSK